MYTLLILATLGQFPLLNQQAAGPWPSFMERIGPATDPPAGDGVIVLAFTATWCSPCARMRPVLEAIEAEGVIVRRIDYDAERALALAHRVTSLPTVIVLQSGTEVARHVGSASLDTLRALTRPPGPRVRYQPAFTLRWRRLTRSR